MNKDGWTSRETVFFSEGCKSKQCVWWKSLSLTLRSTWVHHNFMCSTAEIFKVCLKLVTSMNMSVLIISKPEVNEWIFFPPLKHVAVNVLQCFMLPQAQSWYNSYLRINVSLFHSIYFMTACDMQKKRPQRFRQMLWRKSRLVKIKGDLNENKGKFNRVHSCIH